MTPGGIISAILIGAELLAPVIPDPARSGLRSAVTVLRSIPSLVDGLVEDGWDADAVEAARLALLGALDAIPGVETQHARRIAGGLVAVVDLIVTRASGNPSAIRERAVARAKRLREEAVAARAGEVVR